MNYADIIDMRELLEDVNSDEDWYVAGIALASANVVSKTTGMLQQSAAAAQSAATYGFNAGVQLDIDASNTQSELAQTSSLASTLSGNNINILTGLNQGVNRGAASTALGMTLIQGSHLNATNAINISTGELSVLASRDTSSSSSETQNGHITIAKTVWGAVSGPTVNASYDRNQTKDKTTTYNNATLTAGDINIITVGDTRIEGANLSTNNRLNLDVGGDLLLESKQNRASGSNKGFGVSAGISFGEKDEPRVKGLNGGFNTSSGRYQNKETVLSSITGSEVNVNVAGNTNIVGALLASLNSEGKDNGQLSLTTGSLSFTDLSNTGFNSQQSMGLSTSVGVSKTGVSGGSSTFTYSNESSYDKSKTLATIGQGTVTIGGEEADSSETTVGALAGLNRDSSNLTKEFYSVDRQQGNIDLTVDHRLLSEEGRKGIATDFVRTGDIGSDLAKALDDTFAQDSDAAEDQQNLWENFVQRNATTNTIVVQAQSEEQQALLKGEGGSEGSLAGVNHLVDSLDVNLEQEGTDALLYDGYKVDAGTGMAEGYYQNDTATVGVNIQKTDMTNSTSVVETVVHEYNHGLLTGASSEAVAESRAQSAGEQWQTYSELGGYNTQSSTSQTNWVAQNRNSSAVTRGTHTTQQASLRERHFRQPAVKELRLVESAAAGYAQKNGMSVEQARKELTQQMLLQVDKSWSEQNHITENPEARKALIAMGMGSAFSDINDVPFIDAQQSLFVAEGEDFDNHYKNAENVSDGAYSTNHREVETISTVNVDGNDINYAEYLRQYGTADGSVTLPSSKDYGTSLGNTVKAGQAIVTAIAGNEDYFGLLADTASTMASNCYDSGINCIVGSDGAALDKLTIDALLQDPVSAAGNDIAGVVEFVGGVAGLGFGKLATGAAKEGVEALWDTATATTKGDGSLSWRDKDFGDSDFYDLGSPFQKHSTNIDDNVTIITKDKSLPDWIQESFLDSQYRTVLTNEDIIVYRAFGGKAELHGAFVSTTPAPNRIQSKIDSALLPEWKNSREFEAQIVIPKGTVLNIGVVAPQTIKSSGTVLNGLGDQVLLPEMWPNEWVKFVKSIKP